MHTVPVAVSSAMHAAHHSHSPPSPATHAICHAPPATHDNLFAGMSSPDDAEANLKYKSFT